MEKHNLQALAIGLHLTNLQIVALNEMGQDILDGKGDYQSVAESLETNEDKYLRYWLENYGKEIDSDGGWTGCYAVVHFGTEDNPHDVPFYLLSERRRGDARFSASLSKAAIFTISHDAQKAMKEENKYLKSIKSPLANRLFVVQLYAKKMERNGND